MILVSKYPKMRGKPAQAVSSGQHPNDRIHIEALVFKKVV